MQAISGHNETRNPFERHSGSFAMLKHRLLQAKTNVHKAMTAESLPDGRGTAAQRNAPGTRCRSTASTELLLEHFLDLPNLFLDFAEVVFGFAFGL